MTTTEARRILREYYGKSLPTEADDFLFTEALGFLIEKTKEPRYMMELGGWYYDKREFDLALKYYEMAAECRYPAAYGCLGYVWYYGRTGEKDYEKAFRYFSLSAEAGDLESAYKVADMYKNGYFVEKDPEKYKAIIEKLYKKTENDRELFSPLPQICLRLARIRAEEGKPEEAVALYRRARPYLEQRLRINSFFGDLNNIRWLIEELYRLVEPDPEEIGLYDLFEWLREPRAVSFRFEGRRYRVESVVENGEYAVRFGEKWYRTIVDFFLKAAIGDRKLTSVYDELYCFEVLS